MQGSERHDVHVSVQDQAPSTGSGRQQNTRHIGPAGIVPLHGHEIGVRLHGCGIRIPFPGLQTQVHEAPVDQLLALRLLTQERGTTDQIRQKPQVFLAQGVHRVDGTILRSHPSGPPSLEPERIEMGVLEVEAEADLLAAEGLQTVFSLPLHPHFQLIRGQWSGSVAGPTFQNLTPPRVPDFHPNFAPGGVRIDPELGPAEAQGSGLDEPSLFVGPERDETVPAKACQMDTALIGAPCRVADIQTAVIEPELVALDDGPRRRQDLGRVDPSLTQPGDGQKRLARATFTQLSRSRLVASFAELTPSWLLWCGGVIPLDSK